MGIFGDGPTVTVVMWALEPILRSQDSQSFSVDTARITKDTFFARDPAQTIDGDKKRVKKDHALTQDK